jgi:hypothetical protein
VIGGGLELVRPGGGRNYELRRDGEVVGTLERRGILRPRYTVAIGGSRWRVDKPRSQRLSVVDEGSGQEIARLEVADDEYRLVAEGEARRAEPSPTMRYDGGERSFYDGTGGRLLTLRHLGGRQDTIATIAPGERPWPSPDPDAGVAVAIAVLVARLVAERDDQGAQEFSAT